MARTAVQRRLTWLRARTTENHPETARVHRLVFEVPEWPGHLPGQHIDLRLTAEDGYTAQRSYSLASPPEEPLLHLLVEQLGGEVSSYLTEELRPEDVLELRGPIGGYFVWSSDADRRTAQPDARPVQLIAGGAGVSPFLSMLEHRRRTGSTTSVQLLYSARTADDVLGRDTLGAETTVTLTRGAPEGWRGQTGRIDSDMLARQTFPPESQPWVYACGPTEFVESTATAMVDLGHEPTSIKLERFGSSGGSS